MALVTKRRTFRLLGLLLFVAPVGQNGLLIGQAAAQMLIAQDLDFDKDVDGSDLILFRGCMSGAGQPHTATITCDDADVDHDGDVDQSDFGILQRCFSGAGLQAEPGCGGCAMPRADRAVGATAFTVSTGTSTNITVAASQIGALYQLRKQPGDISVGSPVAGNDGTLLLPTGPLTSTTTFKILATNAQWGCSVELTATATIIVTAYSSLNKIGVHSVIGPRNGYGDFIRNCAAAGKPVALVKCVDDFGPCYEAKLHSPQTLTIGRKNDLPSCSWGSNCDLQGFDAVAQSGTSPAVHAQRVFDNLRYIWDQNPSVDVWEICNEWSWWWAWQADFYIAFMDIAEAHTRPSDGRPYRIALYGCSGGNPPQAYWPDIARACARAKAHGNHILSLHEYAWNGLLQDEYVAHGDDIVLRYRRLYDYLKTQNADCPLALTEVGQNGGGGFVGIELFVQDFGWYDTRMREDPYVIGCAAWTLGNWGGANFQDALPALTQYIITH